MSSPNEIERWINGLSILPATPLLLDQLRAEVEVLAQQARISPELAQEWRDQIASRSPTPSIENGCDSENQASCVLETSGTGSTTDVETPSSSIPWTTPSSLETSSTSAMSVTRDEATQPKPLAERNTKTSRNALRRPNRPTLSEFTSRGES